MLTKLVKGGPIIGRACSASLSSCEVVGRGVCLVGGTVLNFMLLLLLAFG
jgi:hypothetical protein